MAALMLSWGSQSIEVRLLSSSEVMVLVSHGSKKHSETLSNVVFGGSPVGSLNGCYAAALAQFWKSRKFVYYVYSSPLAGEESTLGRDTQM